MQFFRFMNPADGLPSRDVDAESSNAKAYFRSVIILHNPYQSLTI